jgi:DNA helicase II / ATP-dependent DNA helicase PcrA
VKRHPAVRRVLELLEPLEPGDTVRDDLFELWGDRSLLADLLNAARGDLSQRDVDEVLAHAEVQFGPVDRDENGRLVLGFDGHPLHDGTPMHDALTLDVEDYPILFALDRVRGGRRRPARYDHVVLDEAQELAPLELALIGRALRQGGAVTVVGDAGQQVDPTAWFDGWEATLRALGQSDAEHLMLAVSHRCPPGVSALARALRDHAPAPAPAPGVRMVLSDTDAEADAALVAWLSRPVARGETAVIAADPARARRLFAALPRSLGARLLLDDAVPRGELLVTTVGRVRGLDLARVAIPELSPSAWPATCEARNALYVAVTRVAGELWLGTTARWSPLVTADAVRPVE